MLLTVVENGHAVYQYRGSKWVLILKGNSQDIRPLKRMMLNYGEPLAINGGNRTISAAAQIYAQHDIVVWSQAPCVSPSDSSYEDTQALGAMIKELNPAIEIFVYVPIGYIPDWQGRLYSTAEVIAQVDLITPIPWATGVFLDEYGYDYRVSRDRQNAIVKHCHDNGLNVIANSWSTSYCFSNQDIYLDWVDNYDGTYGFHGNPSNLATELNSGDYYLFETFFWGSEKSGLNYIQQASDKWRVREGYLYRHDPKTEFSGKSYFEQYGTQTIALDTFVGWDDVKYKEAYLGCVALGIHAYGVCTTSYTHADQYINYETPPIVAEYSDIGPTIDGAYNNEYGTQYTATVSGHSVELIWNQPSSISDPSLLNQKFSYTYTVTHGATASGSIEVQLNQVYHYIPVTSGDDITAVGNKIAAFPYTDTTWIVTKSGDSITWTWDDGYNNPPSTTDYSVFPSTTGVTGTGVIKTGAVVVRRSTIDGTGFNATNGPTWRRPFNPPASFQYFDTDLNKIIVWNGTDWTDLFLTPYGPTSARPTEGNYPGRFYFDTTLGVPIWRNASNFAWVGADGDVPVAAPSILVDTTPPSVPATVVVTNYGSVYAKLSWSASTDNVGVTGYKVYRDGASTALATISDGTRTYLDSTLTASTTYSYQITAYDAEGNESAKSASHTVSTTAAASNLFASTNWEVGYYVDGPDLTIVKAEATSRVRVINPVTVSPSTAYTVQVANGYKLYVYEENSSGTVSEWRGWLTGVNTFTTDSTTTQVQAMFALITDDGIDLSHVNVARPTLELA
jgi:hypothetical protein